MVTMAELVEVLSQDRPVIDRTNLMGFYQFSILRASSWLRTHRDSPPEADREALAKAGLRLDATSAAIEVVVIDHIEKSPTEN